MTCASCGQRYDQTDDYKVGDRHDGSAVFCYEFALLECRRRPILMPDVALGYIGPSNAPGSCLAIRGDRVILSLLWSI